MIDRLGVIGVGLMGGSVASAARKYDLCSEIVGFDPDHDNLRNAKRLGVIDDYTSDPEGAVEGADFVVIAVPVGATEQVFSALYKSWSRTAVYTDVGSTKVNVVEAAKAAFGEVPENFVPGHPIAGGEESGVQASTPDLYTGKRVILTPLPDTSPDAMECVTGLWSGVGATVSTMEVTRHDSVLAATSHLPHVIAFALVDMLGRKDEKDEIFRFAAGGFRDFTRLASSDPRMWLDICRANRNEIQHLIEEFKDELTAISEMLEQDSADKLFQLFECSRNARQRFLDQFSD